jgi:hypothetical protein
MNSTSLSNFSLEKIPGLQPATKSQMVERFSLSVMAMTEIEMCEEWLLVVRKPRYGGFGVH